MSQNNMRDKAARAAQLAKAAADIINGAIAGGLHGAAVGAVKGFAPWLIKSCLYILVALLMTSLILFTALPSALFGFEDVTESEILQMNEAAKKADSLYLQFGDITNSQADRLITEFGDGYDEVVSTKEIADLGYNWVAAICSVLHQQELSLIDENSVSDVAKQLLEYTTETEIYEETELVLDEESGEYVETVVEKTRITINISSIDADRLMEKLHFTDVQKEWAYFIYENLEEQQIADGETLPEDIGDLTFTDGSTEVVYYNQKDSRWGHLPYGKSDTIAESGCGPTALAIVVSSLTDTKIIPPQMADWAYKNGYCIPHGGSYHSLIYEGAQHFGLQVEVSGTKDAQKIIDALSSGKLVIAIMGKGTFTTSGHFIVLRGVTSEGKILVADPFSVNFSNREWDLSLILNEASKRAASNKPFWIIGR